MSIYVIFKSIIKQGKDLIFPYTPAAWSLWFHGTLLQFIFVKLVKNQTLKLQKNLKIYETNGETCNCIGQNC